VESLLNDLYIMAREQLSETRQTNQLLTELNDNLIAMLNAMAEDAEPDSTPLVDMDGNAV